MINVNNLNAKAIIEKLELKEHTLYEVKVKFSPQNVIHKSFLFTGFKETGGYSEVYINNYEGPVKLDDVYSIRIVKELAKIKD